MRQSCRADQGSTRRSAHGDAQSFREPASSTRRWAATRCLTLRPYLLPAVVREHGKRIELRRRRDLLQAGAVHVDHVQIEVASARVLVVGREDDALGVGM